MKSYLYILTSALAAGGTLSCSASREPTTGVATTDDDAGASSSSPGTSGGSGDPVPRDPAPDAGTVGASALLAEAESIMASLTATHYQHASHIDASHGIYDVDCSGLTNYALAVAVSDSYEALVNATVSRPVAESYVSFIASLDQPVGRWHRVTAVARLAPGDLLAWRIPKGVKSSDTGHVMIVEKAPVIVGDQAEVGIIDSTDTGHGDVDPRLPKGPSGLGRGTTVVMVAADGTATGYRWSMDSDSPPYTTEVVMAHLDDVHASGVSED